MADNLGRAELGLGADLAPLDRDLAKAERRIALFVATTQRMLDGLHARLNVETGALETLAARAATASPGSTTIVREGGASRTVNEANRIYGVRGPERPGSITNPIVTVLAASKFFPMGSYGAAIGESNVTDAQRSDQASGYATAADMAALTAAVHDLARGANPANRLASAGQAGMGEPNSPERIAVSLGDSENRVLRDMAATLAKIEGRAAGGSGSRTTVLNSSSDSTTGHVPVILSGGSGGGAVIPAAVAGAGGGGSRRVDIFYHPGSGGDGGSGSLLSKLLWGGGAGALGLAGFGSVGSLAGLGPEHVLMTVLGLAGSAVNAGIGGGLLGLGSLGKIGVGMGSDAAVMASTIADTQTLYKDYANLSQAVALYGRNSQQAHQAQAQLNADMSAFGSTVGVQAEARLARLTAAVNSYWDATSGPARVQAVRILTQGLASG